MSAKFTNLKYDPTTYRQDINRSVNPGMYRLDPNFAINTNKCFAPYGPRGGHEGSESVYDQTDIDSLLRGIPNKNTRYQVPQPMGTYALQNLNERPDILETQYSRLSCPASDIKGLNVPDMRFDYPLYDPQCQIFENFEINTRLQAKDNHKADWQAPLNQRGLLPTERLGKIKKCNVTLDCYAPVE